MSRLEQLLELASGAPQDPLCQYALGLEYLNQGQWAKAIAAFEKTLKIDCKYAAAYYHKARAEIRASKRDDAKKTLAAGIECSRAGRDEKTEREMHALLETIS